MADDRDYRLVLYSLLLYFRELQFENLPLGVVVIPSSSVVVSSRSFNSCSSEPTTFCGSTWKSCIVTPLLLSVLRSVVVVVVLNVNEDVVVVPDVVVAADVHVRGIAMETVVLATLSPVDGVVLVQVESVGVSLFVE